MNALTASEVTPLHVYRDRLPYPVWMLYRTIRTVAVASAFAGFWSGGVLLSLRTTGFDVDAGASSPRASASSSA